MKPPEIAPDIAPSAPAAAPTQHAPAYVAPLLSALSAALPAAANPPRAAATTLAPGTGIRAIADIPAYPTTFPTLVPMSCTFEYAALSFIPSNFIHVAYASSVTSVFTYSAVFSLPKNTGPIAIAKLSVMFSPTLEIPDRTDA